MRRVSTVRAVAVVAVAVVAAAPAATQAPAVVRTAVAAGDSDFISSFLVGHCMAIIFRV